MKKPLCRGWREAQWLIALTNPAEIPGLIPSTHIRQLTVAYNSCSRGSRTFFCASRAPACMVYIQMGVYTDTCMVYMQTNRHKNVHMNNKNKCRFKKNNKLCDLFVCVPCTYLKS